MTLIDPIRFTPVQLETLDLGYSAFPDIQPFSARAGIGYQELLESIRRYITKTLIPYLVDVNPQALWDGNVDKLLGALDTVITQSQTEINTALTEQQAAINQQLADTLAGLVGGSINVTDPVINTAVTTPTSQTRLSLDALYKDPLTALTTNGGRLAPESLDGEVAAVAGDAGSQTRAAFDAAYQKVQFQVANGYIQWRYQSDATWTNLEAIADLIGGTGPTGQAGAPGGAAELAYAEITTGGAISIPIGSGTTDLPGMTLSFVMPSRPVMLELQAIIRYAASSGSQDAKLRIVETTGGASTTIIDVHSGWSGGIGDNAQLFARRRITGTAGVTRTFKVTGVQDAAVVWTVSPNAAYPIAVGAYTV